MSIKSFFRRNLKKNKPIFIVDNSEELDNLDEELSKADIIGLDTEFDWRTTYFPKLSLIQIVAISFCQERCNCIKQVLEYSLFKRF